jgi:sulfur dioxygenase
MNYSVKQLNPNACLTYLIIREGSNKAAIVDPVLEHLEDYTDLLKREGLDLEYIVDTHTHADHISCGPALKDVTGAKYLMHGDAPAKCVDTKITEETEMELLPGLTARFLFTPGHTRDSVSMVLPGQVFTGDALFLDTGGAGRDDLPGGDPAAHFDSLQKLTNLGEGLMVYPAHDYRGRKPSSIGTQVKTNPHLQKKTKDEFVQYVEDLKLGPAEWMHDVLNANYACARDPNAAWIPVDTPACEVKGTLDPGVNEIEVRPISVDEVRAMLKDSAPPVLLDVRDPAELQEQLGHIEGVINIPVNHLPRQMDKIEKHKADPIITICRSGHRASTAAQILTKVGFEDVKVMDGGMIAWNS